MKKYTVETCTKDLKTTGGGKVIQAILENTSAYPLHIMTQLEQSIIANARRELVAVLSFYKSKQNGQATAYDDADYLVHFHSLNALLMLAHQVNSGMSAVAIQALIEIEEEHAAAFRAISR